MGNLIGTPKRAQQPARKAPPAPTRPKRDRTPYRNPHDTVHTNSQNKKSSSTLRRSLCPNPDDTVMTPIELDEKDVTATRNLCSACGN